MTDGRPQQIYIIQHKDPVSYEFTISKDRVKQVLAETQSGHPFRSKAWVGSITYIVELEYVPPSAMSGVLQAKLQPPPSTESCPAVHPPGQCPSCDKFFSIDPSQCLYAEERRPAPHQRCFLREGHDGPHRLGTPPAADIIAQNHAYHGVIIPSDQDRCISTSISKPPIRCTLLANHSGPHFYDIRIPYDNAI